MTAPPGPFGPLDLHLHSTVSPDGYSSIEEHCRVALRRGLREVAFVEHADFHPDDPSYLSFDPARYTRELNAARERFAGRLTIRKGLELSVHPTLLDRARAAAEDPSLDLVVAAVHVVEGNFVWTEAFLRLGLERAYQLYFDEVARTLDYGLAQVLGHIDLPARSLPVGIELERIRARREGLERTLNMLCAAGVVLEINTSGKRRREDRLIPELDVVARFVELGGQVTLGSDAHRAQDIACYFEVVLPELRKLGVEALATFEGRELKLVPF